MSLYQDNRSLSSVSVQIASCLLIRPACIRRKGKAVISCVYFGCTNRSFGSNARWTEVRDEMESLFELMEQVQNKLDRDATSKEAGSRMDLRKCDWGAVMGEVVRTAQRWKSRPNKQGKVMLFIDKIGRNSSALETWLSILPMGDYGSRYTSVPHYNLYRILRLCPASAAYSKLPLEYANQIYQVEIGDQTQLTKYRPRASIPKSRKVSMKHYRRFPESWKVQRDTSTCTDECESSLSSSERLSFFAPS